MLKVVLETNQFVGSLIIKKGISAQVFQAWRDFAYVLIISKHILSEIKKVLQYPRIAKKYNVKNKDIKLLINLIERDAVVLHKLPRVNVIKDDPTDNKFLACALETNAQYIVSGDKHLLNLKRFKGTKIITASEFIKVI